MNIMIIGPANSIHTQRWINSFTDKGHKISLISLSEHKAKPNTINGKVNVYYIKSRFKLGYYLGANRVKKIYRSIKPDIVHAYYASGYGTLARLSRIPKYLLAIWGSDVYEYPFRNRFNMSIILKNLKKPVCLTCTSENLKNQVLKLTEAEHIIVIPFGVDTKMFDNQTPKSQSKSIKIGLVKSLENIYGINYFIEAIRILKDLLVKANENIDVKAEIFGDGSERDRLRRLIVEYDLSNEVKLMGSVAHNRVPSILSTFDIFCLTSNEESFGVALVEAMAIGLPTVVTDTPGFTEIISKQNVGIVVKRKEPSKIAEALLKLVLNKEMRQKMGEEARKLVNEKYNWDKNVNKMIDVYNSYVMDDEI